ncbi:MAG TPA: diguanylate cyclase [Acidimicrobiia bacterium]|nr:diguanylate cyclase [Acidimicrobiia bacterium]
MVRNPRLAAAVGLALVAAASGALAWGLEAPALGAVSAASGVAAAAVASIAFGSPASDGGPGTRGQHGTARPTPIVATPATVPDAGAPVDPDAPDAADPGLATMAAPKTAEEDANELVDPVTGMLDHRYFIVALERRVAASRRKLTPFALVILELTPEDPRRHRVTDQSMKVLAAVVRAVLRDSDTGCRIDEHTIGVLLEDTPEAGALWATERVRAGFFATTFRGNVRLAAGIAAYPGSALEPDRLLAAARDAARQSRDLGDESIQLAEPEESSPS